MKTNRWTILPKAFFLAAFFFLTGDVLAHKLNLELENAPTTDVVGFYVKLGIEHIVPLGLDHILFVVALCLLRNSLKSILWQATAFTVAHSITLALSMKSMIALPSAVVEPVITLSIAFVALENLLLREVRAWRILIVFIFGLIHGLGFASVLNEIGLPPDRFMTALVSFNIGVEIGQVMVILLVFGLFVLPFKNQPKNYSRLAAFTSIAIAITAMYWTVERIF
jgi:uncharacterized membrane protein